MEIIDKTTLELAFEEFNALIDEFNQDFSEAETQKKRDQVEKKYKGRINNAEKKLEKDINEAFEKEQADLKKEEEAIYAVSIDKSLFRSIKKKYNKNELKNILSENGLKGLSRLNEDELITLLFTNELLEKIQL